MNEMDPVQALGLLDQYVAKAGLDRADTFASIRATQVLRQLLVATGFLPGEPQAGAEATTTAPFEAEDEPTPPRNGRGQAKAAAATKENQR